MSDSLIEQPAMIPPSAWVETHGRLIPGGGRVLDLACGRGRHSKLLAGMGYRVLSVDRDGDAVAGLEGWPGIEVCIADLEGDRWPLAGQVFAGVVVANYLWRPRLAEVMALLAPGGVLIYETFMRGNDAYGKPSRPDFLLLPGELRRLAKTAGLREIAFAEGYCAEPKPAMRQAICACRE